jgi:hypothetical protein
MAFLALLITAAACSSATPTPSPHLTPLPTPAEPEDVAQRALALALSELDHDLDQARSLLRFIATSSPAREGHADECTESVKQLLNTNPRYTQIAVISPDGELFCDSTPGAGPRNVVEHLVYSRAVDTSDFAVGEYLIGGGTGVPTLGLGFPVGDGEEYPPGVALAFLNLNWLAQRFAEIEIPVTGEILLLDTYGTILLRDPDAGEWSGKNVQRTALGRAMLSRVRGAGELAGADGETRYYAFSSPTLANRTLLIAVGVKK